MKTTTINRIREAACHGQRVVIGRYTYKADLWSRTIMRCKTDDIGREWIDWEGRRFDGWEIVAHL